MYFPDMLSKVGLAEDNVILTMGITTTTKMDGFNGVGMPNALTENTRDILRQLNCELYFMRPNVRIIKFNDK